MSDYFEEKEILVRESEYNTMCEYLNSFANLVEEQREEIEILKQRNSYERHNTNLDKYKKILSINKEIEILEVRS